MGSYITNLPVNGKFSVTAVFGQSGPLWKNGHKGIDIVSNDKTIYSVCDGCVTVVGNDKNGWGRYVSIKPSGFERIRIILCHLKEGSIKVKKGDSVSRKSVIGTMGTTGNSTGVHLHIEMRIDNCATDISSYLGIKNEIKSGLLDTDYKVSAKEQQKMLNAILSDFDKKSGCNCDEQIKKLNDELKNVKKKLAAAEEIIFAIKKILA